MTYKVLHILTVLHRNLPYFPVGIGSRKQLRIIHLVNTDQINLICNVRSMGLTVGHILNITNIHHSVTAIDSPTAVSAEESKTKLKESTTTSTAS